MKSCGAMVDEHSWLSWHLYLNLNAVSINLIYFQFGLIKIDGVYC